MLIYLRKIERNSCFIQDDDKGEDGDDYGNNSKNIHLYKMVMKMVMNTEIR